MKVVIDRFEDVFAVCETENGKMINIEKEKLPVNAREGDVLVICNDKISVDVEETEKRKKEIEELTKGLWN
jgi:hypothetical protein